VFVGSDKPDNVTHSKLGVCNHLRHLIDLRKLILGHSAEDLQAEHCAMLRQWPKSGWLDVSSQLLQKPDIRIQLLGQTADDSSGRHHFPIDHVEQLHWIKSKLLTNFEDAGVSLNSECDDMLRELINDWLSHLLF
jgi:hypothetical protein